MKVYEGYFVLPPDAVQDARKNQLAALEGLITKFGGKVLQRNELGRRQLGYIIRKNRDGFVISIDFEMKPASLEGFRRALQLHEDLVKFMITCKVIPTEAELAAQAKAAASQAAAKPAYGYKKSAPSSQKVSAS